MRNKQLFYMVLIKIKLEFSWHWKLKKDICRNKMQDIKTTSSSVIALLFIAEILLNRSCIKKRGWNYLRINHSIYQ
jgi:hypothetical protein